MLENQKFRPATVIGPLGEALTLSTIPSAQTTRLTIRRKAEVVGAVTGELLMVREAGDRYALTVEEFTTWLRRRKPQRDVRTYRRALRHVRRK